MKDVLKVHCAYEDSLICVADGTPPLPEGDGSYIPSTRPGTRSPHVWLSDGSSTLDLFGDGFVLLRLGPSPPDGTELIKAARGRGIPICESVIDEDPVLDAYEARLVLVRPDGHVAWRGETRPDEILQVIDTMVGITNCKYVIYVKRN